MAVTCECGKTHSDWVPKDRLDKVTEQRRDAVRQVSELESKVGELETQLGDATRAGKGADALQARVAELESQVATHSTREAILMAGVTDSEGLDVVSVLYQRVPEADRPKGGIAEWLKKADSLPKAVRAYLPEGTSTTTEGGTATEGGKGSTTEAGKTSSSTGLPKANTGASGAAPTGSSYSPDAIDQMTPAQYAAHREAILASLEGGR